MVFSPPMNYSRWCLLNFLFASLMCILREPNVFWSISKIFSLIYSFALALNVIQWTLMYGAVQLLLKNLCFSPVDARYNIGYLLSNQPYTTFSLYLLLEFLVYMSSLTFYYYAYVRFQQHDQSSCYDRCSNYCPSLVAIIILLLYTACKMPLVHDIFLLFIQTRIRLLFITFIFEICHVLVLLTLWICLTAKLNWHIETEEKLRMKVPCSVVVKNTPVPPIATTTLSLPDLNRDSALDEKPYEKIRIFQSEIYYRNRPKNWSLPLNQQASMMATFDADDDIVLRSPNKNEVQYRDAIRKTVPNIYQIPNTSSHERTKAVFLRGNTPPTPPVKRFRKEQVDAARKRAEQMFSSQQRTAEYIPHRHSAALLISQVWRLLSYQTGSINRFLGANVRFGRASFGLRVVVLVRNVFSSSNSSWRIRVPNRRRWTSEETDILLRTVFQTMFRTGFWTTIEKTMSRKTWTSLLRLDEWQRSNLTDGEFWFEKA